MIPGSSPSSGHFGEASSKAAEKGMIWHLVNSSLGGDSKGETGPRVKGHKGMRL